MGTGRLTGGFDEASALGSAAFLEDVGTKGPCLGSGGNVLLVLPVWLRDFVWGVEKSEGGPFRELVAYRALDRALYRCEDGQLAGLDSGRARVRLSTDPRDPARIRWLLESRSGGGGKHYHGGFR